MTSAGDMSLSDQAKVEWFCLLVVGPAPFLNVKPLSFLVADPFIDIACSLPEVVVPMSGLQIGLLLALLCGSSAATAAASDPLAITAEEHAACDADAMNLCSGVDRNLDSLLACMKANRAQLSPTCRISFVAGMKRRHLPL